MTLVKICGIRRSADIEILNELLPDYAGFIFCDSKRKVTLSEAEDLVKKLDNNIKRVGVFKDNDVNEVVDTARALKLDAVQLHGAEGGKYLSSLTPFNIWKTVHVNVNYVSKNDIWQKIHSTCKLDIEAVLLDSSVRGKNGGTGVSFNWNVLEGIHIDKKLVLAGGLNSENIVQAIKVVRPEVVDVSGGVEENGMKSFKKIKDFIGKVRSI
ncbi:phosphoribosylanthranilate isomerase [Clostridium sp. MT-14]|uniref:N-(5'-phosphoribosyl)anthranilate isomerase n=1 Tax=Clostridium aromativorans TaxID=2836848 RepID=A0ABS8N6I8_9CLOT|nr:phosphoribosylanthranilate isomerase [Clostridium aromativorans]MCC9295407.1 phosphoribosylanthranilate isomerase [Clostridium aromativorans]